VFERAKAVHALDRAATVPAETQDIGWKTESNSHPKDVRIGENNNKIDLAEMM
jgi:hypothetical protein